MVHHIQKGVFKATTKQKDNIIDSIFQLFQHFNNLDSSIPKDAGADFGKGRDWNVDLIPKFLMANGEQK